jgi:HK97 gp10 family phage protein
MATKVEGADKLRRKMAGFPALAKEEISRAMETGAQEIVNLAKRLVPVDQGDLRDSIGWTWGAAPKGAVALTTIGEGPNLRITVYAGNEKAYYARWVEFGTQQNRARPFFYVSYRAIRKRIRSRVTRAISKAAKRAAGKT